MSIGSDIRILTVAKTFSPNVISTDIEGHLKHKWSLVGPVELGRDLKNSYEYFSMVCYLYGLRLHKELKVIEE